MSKTGATRYQKFLKAEKAKTKLKGKKDKELPKGTNVTKTNFKVKKIVIKEQLKRHNSSEALTSRKLNAKELLSRLNHFNINARVDALDGLTEIITSNPEILQENLGQLINGITALLLNVEKSVRHAALKVLHLILSNVTQNKIEPFFDVMSTYLRNAMTHIDSRIQEDSLSFLDILLLCAPMKLAEDFHKIIPNFLDMISKLRIDQPGRILTVNLNTQITSLKWRIKVFQRLKDFMQMYANFKEIDQNKTNDSNKIETFNPSKTNYYPLFNPNYISNCHVSCFSSKSSDVALVIDEIQKFNEYIDILLPLLFETWLEACPDIKSSSTNFEMVVSEDSAILLKHILEVFSLIHSYYKYFNKKSPGLNIKNTFHQKYKAMFTQHFINYFPFVTVVRSKQMKQVESPSDMTIDPKLVMENLKICHLFINFNPKVSKKAQNKEISAVLNYIEQMFCQNKQDSIDDKIISIMYSLFANESVGWIRTSLVLDSLMRKIIWVYFNKTISNAYKQKIFALLCKIALNEKLSHFHSSDAYELWLKHLPDILLSDNINIDTINIIYRFAVTNNTVFNSVLKPKLFDIIKNLPNIVVSNSDTNGHHKLLSLFYYVKGWDTESLDLLESQLMENVYKGDSGKFIFDMLRLKSGAIL